MDAWETLIGNSSLSTGDAWEHLNAQESGGEILVEAIRTAERVVSTSASIEIEQRIAKRVETFSASIDENIYKAEFIDDKNEAEI